MEGANNGKMKQSATSSRVMLTSPIGRWKLLVYLCHLSTNADISPQSLMSTEHAIKGLVMWQQLGPQFQEHAYQISTPSSYGRITSIQDVPELKYKGTDTLLT